MEADGILDPISEIDLYTLHLIFKPMIQKSLERNRLNWNVHKHSSLHYKSPEWAFKEALQRLKSVQREWGKTCTELYQVTLFSNIYISTMTLCHSRQYSTSETKVYHTLCHLTLLHVTVRHVFSYLQMIVQLSVV